MKQLVLDTRSSLVNAEALHVIAKQLQPEIKRMQLVAKAGNYSDERASINLVADHAVQQQVRSLVQQADAIVVVGIGGSNLGTLAIHEALNGKYHNGLRSPRIFFADTVDADSMTDIVSFVEAYLQHKMKVIINLVSKSGATTESIANFEILYDLLKKHTQQPDKHVVVTTDHGSALYNFAQKNDFTVLTMPKTVGGRYSVFSPVGLYPLALLGVDVHSLVEGAHAMRERCLHEKIEDNPAALLAATHYYHAARGRNIADMFLFSTDLESIGKWYRQLIGESIGKEWNRDNTAQVFSGITPTVSIGSTDLHSVGQLYLGGPADKLTTFVTLDHVKQLTVPNMPEYEKLVAHLQGKQLHTIMQAIQQGVMTAYSNAARPYCHIRLPEKSPYVLGQLLQLYMMATMYLGSLMDVNPFDQPNVESYKTETKRILGKPL